MKRFSKLLVAVAALALGALIFAALVASRPEPPASPADERTWTVATATVHIGDVTPRLALYGRVVAGREVALRARVAGPVVKVAPGFAEGTWVERDAILLTIDPFNYRNDLTERRAGAREARARLDELHARMTTQQALLAEDGNQVEIARRDLERRQRLVGNAVSEKSLDDARAVLSRAEVQRLARQEQLATLSAQIAQQEAVITRLNAAVARAERALADTAITAPFAGWLVDVGADLGKTLAANEAVARLIDARRMEVRFYLTGKQLARQPSLPSQDRPLPAQVTWRAGGADGHFAAEVTRIAGEVDPAIDGAHAYARLIGVAPTSPLRPGAFVEVAMDDHTYRAVARLPESALHGGDTVYVVTDGRLDARRVELAGRDGDFVLVAGAGLADGDDVVTTRFTEIGPGVKVAVAP